MISSLLALLLTTASAADWDVQGKAELGARSRTYQERSQSYYSPLVSGEFDTSYSDGDVQYKIMLGGKIFQLDQLEGEPNNAFIGMVSKGMSFKLGYQTVSWGQSFAFLIADLVNPKDLRDPLTTDPAWINLAVPMANMEYFFEGGSLQVLVTPVPRNNKYIRSGKESDIFSMTPGLPTMGEPQNFDNTSMSDAEYGARITKVISGLELNLFGLRHWNRSALYQVVVENGVPVLKPLRYQLNSYGLGFSYDMNKMIEGMVFRGDLVYHSLSYRSSSDFLTATEGPASDWATGLDWTTEFGLDTAVQWIGHVDSTVRDDLGAIKLGKKFFKDTLEIGATVVWGLNRDQTWFKPHITWYPIANLEFNVTHDLVDVDKTQTTATLYPVSKDDRTEVSLKYLF